MDDEPDSAPTITITPPTLNSIQLPQYGDSICMAPLLPSSSSSLSSMAIIGCSSVTGNQWDGQVCIIDLATGLVHASLATYGGNCAVESLQLGEDAYFFSAGDDGVVYCWNYRSVLEAPLESLTSESEGSRKRVKRTDEIKQCKTTSSPSSSSSSPVTDTRPLFNLYDHQNIVSAVSCRSTEVSGRNVGPRTHVLSASWDATVKLWDIEAPGWPLRTFSTGREAYDVNWDPFSAHNFVTGSHSKLVQIWDTRSKGACISRVCDSAVKVTRYNPLKEFEFAVGTQGGSVLLFDSRELSKPLSRGPPCGAINDIQFSPSCPSIFAVASDDARVRVLGSGGPGLSLLTENLVHVDAVKGVTFAKSTPKADGHLVASVSWDSTLKFTTL